MIERSAADATGEPFVLTRVFEAPRALVWKAFSESEQLERWWGPKGFTMVIPRFEFRPGGICHYRMDSPDGFTMWARFVYREIAELERIVFVGSFSDETGEIARAPFFEGRWPLEVLTTVTLEEAGGKTTVTLRGWPIDATDVEQQAYESNFESMQQGYGNALEVLRELLARELTRA